jgi:hypothetical protein
MYTTDNMNHYCTIGHMLATINTDDLVHYIRIVLKSLESQESETFFSVALSLTSKSYLRKSMPKTGRIIGVQGSHPPQLQDPLPQQQLHRQHRYQEVPSQVQNTCKIQVMLDKLSQYVLLHFCSGNFISLGNGKHLIKALCGTQPSQIRAMLLALSTITVITLCWAFTKQDNINTLSMDLYNPQASTFWPPCVILKGKFESTAPYTNHNRCYTHCSMLAPLYTNYVVWYNGSMVTVGTHHALKWKTFKQGRSACRVLLSGTVQYKEDDLQSTTCRRVQLTLSVTG